MALQIKNDTAANLATANEVHALGRPVYASDTRRLKFGDGTTAYNALPFFAERPEDVQIVAFYANEAVAVGDGAGDVRFRVPASLDGFNLSAVAATVVTAGTTGTTNVQIHNVTDAIDMLSTPITIDSGETDSATAATPAAINAGADDVATGDVLRIDVDAVSTTAPQGLVVTLTFTRP